MSGFGLLEAARARVFGNDWYDPFYEAGSGSGEAGSGLEPMPMVESEWIFFGILSFCDFFVLLLLLSSVGGFLRRLCDHSTTSTGRNDNHSRLRAALATQTMTVIVRATPIHDASHGLSVQSSSEARPSAAQVPCYLPNEQFIMMETVDHIMTKLECVACRAASAPC